MKILLKKLVPVICCLMMITASAQQMPFRFAWLTDVHIVRGSESLKDLEKSVADINTMKDVQFVIFTGDISDFGYKADMEVAKGILDALNKPYYIVPGNHDTKWTESGANGFDEVFGHHNIHFNYGNIEFIGFQTGPIARRGDGYISPADLQWIRQQADAAKKKGRIIIPYTHYPWNKAMGNWFELTNLFKQYSVPVALVGHGHRNQKMSFDGIPGVMARTNTSRNNSPVGYTLVDITKDSIYFTERNPEINKSTLWHQLPFHTIDYSQDKPVSADLSINDEFPQVKTEWKINLTGGVSTAVSVDGNRVFVGDREGVFHCLDLSNGKKIWEFNAGKGIFSTPAISGNQVIFGSADKTIYCLNTGTGKLVWKFKADNYVLGSATIDDGKVYIGASDGKFRALDLATGKLVWEYGGIRGWIDNKPLVYQGKIYFGAWDNYFYALDAKTGQLAWKWIRSKREGFPSAFYAPGACWPVAANGKVFLAGPDQVITALDAKTGDSLWRSGRPRINEAIGISADGSRVYVKGTSDSTLAAYSTTANGPELVWKTQDSHSFDDDQAAITEKDGTVFFPLRNGWVIAVNGSDGKVLWKHAVGNTMLNPATPISGKRVIVTDQDGVVMLLKAE